MAPPTPSAARYRDPTDAVWAACARRAGLARPYDGAKRAPSAPLGAPSADVTGPSGGLATSDSLAQRVFHALCRQLTDRAPVGGAAPAMNSDAALRRDRALERATLRLQAAWADRWGLRALMTPEARWRPYWDALPVDPLDDDEAPDAASERARAAWWRALRDPRFTPIDEALRATAALAAAARPFSEPPSAWHDTLALHPLGGARGPSGETCGTCAWLHRAGPGPKVERCHQHRERSGPIAPRISAALSACAQWEPRLSDDECARCGACCRQAFDLVPVERRSPLFRSHPELLAHDAHGAHLPRPDGFCVALRDKAAPYRCAIYAERPRSCDDFAVASASCLLARRRVGLSARLPLTLRSGPSPDPPSTSR